MTQEFQKSEEFREKMSVGKKAWWAECKKDPERYNKVVNKISKNNSRYCKGKFGPDHPGWKGGGWYSEKEGKRYVYVQPGHPSYGYKRHMYEHRYMMEEKLGRRLTPNEEVHHKDGIKDHNEFDNFDLVVKKQHFGKAKCPYCGGEFKVK